MRGERLAEGYVGLDRGKIRGVYAPEIGQLRLAKLHLDLGGGSPLTVDGTIDGLTPARIAGTEALPSLIPGKLGIVLSDVPGGEFERFWAPGPCRGGGGGGIGHRS